MSLNSNNMSMNTNLTNGTNSTELYTMKVFFNPHIMQASNKGLDIMSYSLEDNMWKVEALPCYKDFSNSPITQKYECQKYDDHVFSGQFDNIL